MLTDEDKNWMKEQVREQLQLKRQWFSEQLERVETNLLTEFRKWASPQEMRQRTHAAAIRPLHTEVESLSDRINKLEQR